MHTRTYQENDFPAGCSDSSDDEGGGLIGDHSDVDKDTSGASESETDDHFNDKADNHGASPTQTLGCLPVRARYLFCFVVDMAMGHPIQPDLGRTYGIFSDVDTNVCMISFSVLLLFDNVCT